MLRQFLAHLALFQLNGIQLLEFLTEDAALLGRGCDDLVAGLLQRFAGLALLFVALCLALLALAIEMRLHPCQAPVQSATFRRPAR
ncbi:hypothetical protein D9M68_965030 [compost metagenome]